MDQTIVYKNQVKDNNAEESGFFSISAWFAFIFILVCSYAIMVIQQQVVLTEEVYYNSLGEQLTVERIDEMLQNLTEWQWVGYVIVPVAIVIQCFLITCCLNIGAIFREYKLKFTSFYGMVMKAMIILGISKLAWGFVMIFTEVTSLEEMTNLDYFSLAALIGYDRLPEWSTAAFGTLTIWLVLFIAVLSLGVKELLKKNNIIRPYKETLAFTLLTYGVGLVVWVVFLMFLQINYLT